MTTLAIARTKSGNAKIGEAATTHAAQASCPTSCRFYNGGGCYAESGRQGVFVTAPLNKAASEVQATALDVALAEADAIDAMKIMPGRPMRLHTVGDCSTDECARIVAAAAARYVERGGGTCWTYTHAWRDVARESWGKVSVLASCETGQDVRDARARGYATAIVVEEFESDRRYPFDDVQVIPCPAQTRHVPCSDCRLCFDDAARREAGVTVGFEVHGISYAVRQAKLALSDPDNPERRLSSEERIRIIRDRFLRIEDREPTVREIADLIDLNHASIAEWLRYLRGEIVHPAERRRRTRLKVV